MSSDPRAAQHLQALVSVLDEYNQWYMDLLRRIQYPQDTRDHQEGEHPVSFLGWLKGAAQLDFKPQSLERLRNLHDELIEQAQNLSAEAAKTQAPPEYQPFDKLMTYFEEFTIQAYRLGKDAGVPNAGLDDVTGLRSNDALKEDFDKEMERVARQGKPFSIALIRISNPDEIVGNKDGAVDLVSKLIQQSMRSFDDAYQITEYEFILSLKQADTSGGLIALKRLNKMLENAELNGAMPKLLSCIAEPAPGDGLEELIQNIKQELNAHDGEGSGIIEYMDMSPLQRFVKRGGD